MITIAVFSIARQCEIYAQLEMNGFPLENVAFFLWGEVTTGIIDIEKIRKAANL